MSADARESAHGDQMPSEGANSATHPPFVSVITPFYNTEPYIAECIESVLAQTYSNWEYILVNNQSTDGSRSVAERYACRDDRIRLLDTPAHYGQVENFNKALKHMSSQSKYCKVVLADDWLFPECIERMVELAEAHPSIGIVSSYRLYGEEITGDGLPYECKVISGRKACQHMLQDGHYLTGSPTSVLVRADFIREAAEFYPLGWLHDDTEACFRVLAELDLGFIHQVLTFSRKENESVASEAARFGPGPIRKFMFAVKYGPQFFTGEEYRKYLERETDFYGEFLAQSAFQLKSSKFWNFHRRGLRLVGASFWSIGLPKYIFLETLDIIFNPKKTLGRILRLFKNRRSKESAVPVAAETKEQPTSP